MLMGLFRLGKPIAGKGAVSMLAFWLGGAAGGVEVPVDTGKASDWIIRRRRRKVSSRRR